MARSLLTFGCAVAVPGALTPLGKVSAILWKGNPHTLRDCIQLRLERPELENEFGMGTARVGNLIADFRVGLRHAPISKIKQVVFHPLLEPCDMVRQLPNRFDGRPIEGDLMSQEDPADPGDQPFGESEALRWTDG